MKKFKLYDLLISMVMIVIFLVTSLVQRDNTFLLGYFVVGGWQLVGMVVHIYHNWFTQAGGRRYYYTCTVFIVLVIAVLGFIISPLLVIYYVMLFAAPFMALYYAWICYKELSSIYRHELIHLK
ncbi:MAG: hypothetical protein HYX40_09465 [Sphingobacteriales bacterium]|nr:hypothetical protein [Sphingobacteriales bacterium]